MQVPGTCVGGDVLQRCTELRHVVILVLPPRSKQRREFWLLLCLAPPRSGPSYDPVWLMNFIWSRKSV